MDYSIKIGGEAGQGVQTVGELLSQVFAQGGYHVFSHQDYESRVRGGHNFYQVRVALERVTSPASSVDIVVALDRASVDMHRMELRKNGVLAYDLTALGEIQGGTEMLGIPFGELATKESGSALMANTVAVGAVLGMLGMSLGPLEALLHAHFKKKGEAVVEGNLKAARAGHAYAKANCKACRFIPLKPDRGPMRLLNALEASAVGALASGLKFYSAYPMTPATGVMNHIAERAVKHGIVVEQAEDEIAAINMAIGASFAGVRAATGSSGGGFALMVEGLSLAGMTETPIVIFEVQRPGPATGLPTRTEQADLLFVVHTGHGEFPRVVFAPGSPEEALTLTNKAFDLAEKYQIPAFVMFDQHLADSQWTYESIDTSKLVYKDYRVRGAEAAALGSTYKRHAYREDGISPMAVPGDSTGALVVTDSDEHDEEGHLIEDAPTRVAMMQKRLHRKFGRIRAEIAPPLRYGSEQANVAFVSWGSTYGVMREVVDVLNARGGKVVMLHFSEVYPLPDPSGYMDVLKSAKVRVCVEGNATSQFARLLRAETGFEFDRLLTRFDGRPFTPEYIVRGLNL